MIIPPLKRKNRDREFNTYSEALRAKVIYNYLFNGMSHRALDDKIIGLDPDESKGWQSMNILHFLGMRKEYKNIFSGYKINDAISNLAKDKNKDILLIIKHLEVYENSQLKIYPETLSSDEEYFEGSKKTITINSYERNDVARKTCIAHYGAVCSVCDIEFSKIYGAIGKGFIHVHHLIELSSIKSEYNVNPVKDLRPVCPNCHAMLHRKKPPYTIQELSVIFKKT